MWKRDVKLVMIAIGAFVFSTQAFAAELLIGIDLDGHGAAGFLRSSLRHELHRFVNRVRGRQSVGEPDDFGVRCLFAIGENHNRRE